MSFVTNPSQQMTLDDSTLHLTKREQKALENSWAKTFADEVFPMIREEPFSVLYCQDNGAPNTPVNVTVGAEIIRACFGYSDDAMVEGLMLDIRLQYALHTTSYEEQPLSDKSLQRFRRRCYQYELKTGIDLMHDCISSLSKSIAKVMNISGKTRRMDSMMIEANIKKLSRMELIYTCIADVVLRLKKEKVENIPESLLHYAEANDFNQTFYYAKQTDYSERCINLLADAETLLTFCKEGYDDWKEYKLFSRCMSEQTVCDENGRRLATKEDGTMHSSILQNPSDPEATFRSKAGQEHRGYVANLEESVGENGSVVTEYQFEQNTYSDEKFLHDSLESMEPSKETITLTTDGAYATPKNIELASEKNVRLISTNLIGRKANEFYADFTLSPDGKQILSCPGKSDPILQGHPYKNGQMRVLFPISACHNCPHKDQCTAKKGKHSAAFTISISAINRAKTQKMMHEEEGRNYAKLRNGVETLPSLLRRKYQVDALPRGRLPGKLFFGIKIAALNFKKLLTFRKGVGNYAKNPVIA